MYAIFKTGGKQYKVSEGETICIDKLALEPKAKVEFNEVLFVDSKAGTPMVEGAKVEGEVIAQGKDKKIIIFKSRRRKDSKLKKGFRRQFTQVKITKITA